MPEPVARHVHRTALSLALWLAVAAAGAQTSLVDATGRTFEADTARVITLGGDLTEIAFALGEADRLVAVDTSSIHPADAVAELPKVGYVRRLSAEGVLSLGPTLILASADAGPPEVVEQLRAAGVAFATVPGEDSVEGAKEKIRFLGEVFDAGERADDLVRQIELDLLEAQLYLDAVDADAAPQVMFVYARGAGSLQVSGTATGAHAMIELAGAENAVTGYEGYKPLTAEAAVTAAPDALLFMSSGLESLGGIAGLADVPGLALTPAYQDERIVAMDGLYLLGFGPRTGEAIRELTLALHPDVRQAAR
jgi:iron complex transport system substrate-binding protein